MKKTESKKRFYVLKLHLVSGVQYRNIVPIVQTHLQGCFQRSLYEEFLRALWWNGAKEKLQCIIPSSSIYNSIEIITKLMWYVN